MSEDEEMIAELCKKNDALLKRIKEYNRTRQKMVAVLRDIEWGGSRSTDHLSCCPDCQRTISEGHYPVCEVRAAIELGERNP